MDVSLQPGASHTGHAAVDAARNLREGDKLFGRVQEYLGDGRYRFATNPRHYRQQQEPQRRLRQS